MTISSLILRMVHFLPPVLVLVQLLLIICHALVPRHDAMETLYPGPFCQNLVITCISIETRALPKVKDMTNGTVLELISFLGRTADIVTILKHLNPHFEASKEQSILNAISYAPHILLLTAEVNESQFPKFSFQFIWHWSHNNTFKSKLFCRIPVFYISLGPE